MTDINKAVEFVRAMGSELEQLRLRVILHEPVDTDKALRLISETQRPDGGWKPFWADTSALDSTCFRLSQLEQVGLLGGEEVVKRAMKFISERQSDNGYWDEDEFLADLAPPWCKPGELGARLYVTSHCAYWLALVYAAPERGNSATTFLSSYVELDGSMPSFLQTHWFTAGVLVTLGETSASERILTCLQRRLGDMDAGDLAWMVNSLRGVGFHVEHPLIEQARAKLVGKQESDGRFRSGDGPDQDVHVTLEAIRATAQSITTATF